MSLIHYTSMVWQILIHGLIWTFSFSAINIDADKAWRLEVKKYLLATLRGNALGRISKNASGERICTHSKSRVGVYRNAQPNLYAVKWNVSLMVKQWNRGKRSNQSATVQKNCVPSAQSTLISGDVTCDGKFRLKFECVQVCVCE